MSAFSRLEKEVTVPRASGGQTCISPEDSHDKVFFLTLLHMTRHTLLFLFCIFLLFVVCCDSTCNYCNKDYESVTDECNSERNDERNSERKNEGNRERNSSTALLIRILVDKIAHTCR